MIRMLLDTDLSLGDVGSEIDDGFALAFALAEPDCRVELITTVSGNVDAVTAARLTRGLLATLGHSDIPVVAGATSASLGPPPKGSSGQAAIELVRRILESPGELTLVAIGPLTNVALALQIEPTVAGAVREVVAMGGIFFDQTHEHRQPGEFNFLCDPEAVNVVLDSGIPIRFVGRDVTEQVRFSRDDARALTAAGGKFAAAGSYALAWIERLARENPGRTVDSCALHDPLALATAIHPGLCTFTMANVRVLVGDPAGRGVSLADLLSGDTAPAPNCRIATDVDVAAFRELFARRLGSM